MPVTANENSNYNRFAWYRTYNSWGFFMSTTPTDDTIDDPVERLREDEEAVELFERLADSNAQCADRFQNALEKAGVR